MNTDTKQITELTSEFFKTQPVDKALLFGSFSHGEATEDSDDDILVRYDNDAKITLLFISHISKIGVLEKILHRKVDLVEEGSLLPFAEETANHDKILIYK